MIRSAENQKEKRTGPFCQAAGCFDVADVYIVLKETDEPYYYEASKHGNYEVEKGLGKEIEFDGFKMILYLCCRHDGEFKYLIKGSELRISRRCDLRAPQIS